MKTLTKAALAVVVSFMFCSFAYAEVPKTLNFQGRLTDADQNPLEGAYSATFSIYNTFTGGSPLWTETQSVSVADGIYSCILGEGTPLNLSFDEACYLEVSVSGQVLSPRQKLSATPYALNSERLGGYLYNEFLHTDESGNVGIGTANPKTALEVDGDITIGDDDWIGIASPNNARIQFDFTPAPDNIDICDANLRISGNVSFYIGGADGTAEIGRLFNSAGDLTFQGVGNRDIAFGSDSNPKLLFVNGLYSNVGIGTTSPQEKLHVDGKVKAEEFITGDITFTNKATGETLWRMFEDEEGLYLESAKTGKIYSFVLEEVKK